jgi:hypothetical protein
VARHKQGPPTVKQTAPLRSKPDRVRNPGGLGHHDSQGAQTGVEGTRGGGGTFALEVGAHEQVHRAQFAAVDRPPANPGALEAEAERGVSQLLAGRPFVPQLAATPGMVLSHPGMTPARLIANYTSFWSGLDTRALGQRLFEIAWLSGRHHDFVRQTIAALAASDLDDDVASVFAQSARDENLQDFARTSEGRSMLRQAARSMTGGWVAGTERYQAVRLTRAADLGEGLETGLSTGRRLLMDAAASRVPGAPSGAPILTVAEQRSRLDLIRVTLARFQASTSPGIADAAAGLRTDAASLRALLEQPGNTVGPIVSVGLPLLRRIENAIVRLDQQLAVYSDPASALGPKAGAYESLTRLVRAQYIEALPQALRAGGVVAFNRAEHVAQRLPRALMEVDLAVLGARSPTYNILSTRRAEFLDGVTWTQRQLAELETLGAEIAAHRERGEAPPLALVERFESRHQVLSLTVQALGYMEMGFAAYEFLAGGGNVVLAGYQDCSNILQHGKDMLAQAQAWELTQLRAKLHRHQTDPGLARFHRALPAYVQYSSLVISLSITLVAAAATAGVGSLVTGSLGAASGGLALAGTAALEALTFTVVHRGLSTQAGQDPSSSFLTDLIWNFGLFTVMRGAGGAIHGRLQGSALQTLEAPIQMGANLGLLGSYGVLRFRVEQGRLPNSDELSQMTAETLVMVAAIAVTTRGFSRAGQAWARYRQLKILRGQYGAQFYSLEATRVSLEAEVRSAIARGESDAAVLSLLRSRFVELEASYRTLTQQVQAEGRINLPALRAELENYLGQTETSSRLLAESLGLPSEVQPQAGGTTTDFTISAGQAAIVASSYRLQGAAVTVQQSRGPLRSVQVTRDGQPTLVFAERAPDLSSNSLVVDANVAIALQKQATGQPLQAGEAALLARLSSFPQYTDLRLTETAAQESGSMLQRIETTVSRSDPSWVAIHSELVRANVGRTKGINDRLIVADLFFARSNSTDPPTFATMDTGISNPLLLLSGRNPAKLGRPVSEAFPDGFDLTLDGRTIRVLPLPRR